MSEWNDIEIEEGALPPIKPWIVRHAVELGAALLVVTLLSLTIWGIAILITNYDSTAGGSIHFNNGTTIHCEDTDTGDNWVSCDGAEYPIQMVSKVEFDGS